MNWQNIFLITRTLFSKQNTASSFIFNVITYYLSVKTSAIHFEVLEVKVRDWFIEWRKNGDRQYWFFGTVNISVMTVIIIQVPASDSNQSYEIKSPPTVWDRVPKEDAANFESDTILWFAYVVNISKIETFLGRFWIFG